MFDSLSLKHLEAGALLLAGILFGWWQLRDVKRAQAETARQRSLQAASTGTLSPIAAPIAAPLAAQIAAPIATAIDKLAELQADSSPPTAKP